MATDPELFERELRYQQEREGFLEKNGSDHGPEEETVSYEEAMERELEYLRSMKMRLSRPPPGSGLLTPSSQPSVGCRPPPASSLVVEREPEHQRSLEKCALQPYVEREVGYQQAPNTGLALTHVDSGSRPASSRELPSRRSLAGMKRKTSFQPISQRPAGMKRKTSFQPTPQRPLRGFPDWHLPPRQDQYRQAPSRRHLHQPSPQRLQYQQLLLPRPLHQRTSLQQDQQPMQKDSHDQQPLPSQLHEHATSHNIARLWCSLCNIPCMNPVCLEQHLQGKKHKAKWEEVYGSKKNGPNGIQCARCYECNIWCSDETALAQHRVGKKHAARLLSLQLGLN